MRKEEIREGLRRLGPFAHEIELPFGLTTHVPELSWRELERVRLPALKELMWPALLDHFGGSLAGLRVLDTGCNCGGFTVEAAASGAKYVLGIDVVDRYLEQAIFVKDVLDLGNAEFRNLSVDDLDPDEVGHFDVVLCLGLLYHFQNPVLSMQKLAAVTAQMMVIDTDLEPSRSDEPHWRMEVLGKTGPPDQDGNITTSLWRTERWVQFIPTASAVEELLRFLRFKRVVRLNVSPGKEVPDDRYQRGTRGTFLAFR
jgi:tRNA (mo5U34)-methyltransferase